MGCSLEVASAKRIITEAILMSTHSIGFYEDIDKNYLSIFNKYHQICTLLSSILKCHTVCLVMLIISPVASNQDLGPIKYQQVPDFWNVWTRWRVSGLMYLTSEVTVQ